MKMTPLRMVLFRLYNLTLGRTSIGSSIMRNLLIKVLILEKDTRDKYVASSRYFTRDELGQL